MKHQQLVSRTLAIRIVILASLAFVGGLGFVRQVQAADKPQTIAEYCSQYSTVANNILRNACIEGVNSGEECNTYTEVADDPTATAICNKAVEDRKNGIVLQGSMEVTKTPSPTPSPTESTKTTDDYIKYAQSLVQDALDETNNLSDYIDVLHQAGPDAKVKTDEKDNSRCDSYVNGAGNQQKITMYPSLAVVNPTCQKKSGKAPAIIFVNGGGWHANDGNSDFVMYNKPDNAHRATQTGPTASQRGYVGFDLTYRLGSSGVYYMFEDVMRGIKHIRDNADKYGIDPNRIAIWGDSSGGSLVTRAAASGKSGAKVAAGWSPPTNAFLMFKSYKAFLIGIDHSTCIPTDLAGITNTTNLLTGGSGDIAKYGIGIGSNDFSSIGLVQDGNGFHFDAGKLGGDGDIMGFLGQFLTAGQYASETMQNLEVISSQIENGNTTALAGGIINMTASKLTECLDNFKALSPALYASSETPPTILAGFTTDDVVDPQHIYDMYNKLQQLNIKSRMILLQGDTSQPTNPLGANLGNHLDYDARFVCPTLNFLDSVIQPNRGKTDCGTGITSGGSDSSTSATTSSGNNTSASGSSGSNGGSGSSSGSSSSQGQNSSTSSQSAEAKCKAGGGSWADHRGTGNPSCSYPPTPKVCDTWDSSCNGGVSTTERNCSKEINGECSNFNEGIKIDTSKVTTSGGTFCPNGKPPVLVGEPLKKGSYFKC